MEDARALAAAGDDRPRILEWESELERVDALIQRARLGQRNGLAIATAFGTCSPITSCR